MGRGREYLFSSLFYNTDGLNGMRCYNGNIFGLKRYGRTGASTYGPIDNLTLTLNGNWSKAVNDAVTTAAYNNSFEFKDGAKLATEYMYDANGSLIKDLNKGIEIQYNLLNLPSQVKFSDGSTITYTYGADGVKLRTVHKIGGMTNAKDIFIIEYFVFYSGRLFGSVFSS